MAEASPVSSSLSNKGDSLDTSSSKLQHTPSPRKLKRLQSASTDEPHSESKCKRCGWRYPIQNPNSRQRRHHKKICPKRSSIGSEEEIETSVVYGGPEQSGSGGSILTGDHDLTHTAESRETLPLGKMETEKVKEIEEAPNEIETREVDKVEQGLSEVPVRGGEDKLKQVSSEVPTDSGHQASGTGEEEVAGLKQRELGSQQIPVRGGEDKLKQGSSEVPTDSGHQASGTGEEEVAGLKQRELGSQQIPEETPPAGHSPRKESDEEIGSDSGVSSAAGEHDETDPSDDMGSDSSDTPEVAEREDSLPSDDETLEEEKKYGAIQHKHSHPDLTGDASEGEGKPVNVANLITKNDKGKGSSASLPSDVTRDYMALAGVKPSLPSTSGETGQISLRSKDHKHGGEIIPDEENVEEGRLSTARGAEYDLEVILRIQKTHDLICPVCGSQITDRIILRKKRRTFGSKNEAAELPNLTEISSEGSDQEHTTKAITTGGQGTWLERCFGYIGLFRRGT